MDRGRYLRRQDAQRERYEGICSRCGACCGADTDPCARLIKEPDGRYGCADYANRLGLQKTVNSRDFNCVPIRDVAKKRGLRATCAYAAYYAKGR